MPDLVLDYRRLKISGTLTVLGTEAVDVFEENDGYVLHIKNFLWAEVAYLEVRREGRK
jgi:hypothetical protein